MRALAVLTESFNTTANVTSDRNVGYDRKGLGFSQYVLLCLDWQSTLALKRSWGSLVEHGNSSLGTGSLRRTCCYSRTVASCIEEDSGHLVWNTSDALGKGSAQCNYHKPFQHVSMGLLLVSQRNAR